MSQLDNIFSLFVFLARLERVLLSKTESLGAIEAIPCQIFTHVFPAQRCFAAFAVNIGHCMESSEQDALLCLAARHIHSESMQSQKCETAEPSGSAFCPLTRNWTDRLVLGCLEKTANESKGEKLIDSVAGRMSRCAYLRYQLIVTS